MKKEGNALYIKLTGELHKAGARILLGTDTPNPFVVPGFSIHNELQNLVNAGLTPYEAIKAGTHDAAEFLEELDTFGIIAPGRRADMILIEENPLADVAHVGNRVGVMLQGKWFPEKELQKMLEDLVVSYSAAKKRFGDIPVLPSEGEREFVGRYEMKFNDVTIGEESFKEGHLMPLEIKTQKGSY
jgi:adenine deaminase